ncbi:MAG: hypothetical protein HF973_05840 [Chloroflexi bacterium]|nr:hypothetical protein [Chloroflexota bacterium]
MKSAHPIDAQFDEAFADELARLETYNKHLYRPNTYLHKWWARRCGSTFRLILKALADDPAGRDYYAPGGLAGKIILDPMMGGGTTLHEAIRLGANVIGADIDPIPILQARASLTELPLTALEAAFADLYTALRERLAPFFRTSCPICQRETEMWYTLYALRRHCACGESLFVDSLTLRHNNDGSITRICPETHDIWRDDVLVSPALPGEKRPLLTRAHKTCPDCHQPYREPLEDPFYQRYAPIALTGRCPEHDLFFAALRQDDVARLEEADALRGQLPFAPADFALASGSKSHSLKERQVGSYLDLFSSRQLLYLDTAVSFFTDHRPPITDYRLPATAHLNLALLVSTSLEFNSMLCGYKGYGRRRPGAIRHTFTYHAYTFPYTALENNPVYARRERSRTSRRVSGTLSNLFESRIRRGRLWAQSPVERRPKSKTRSEKVSIPDERDAGREVTHFADLQEGSRRFLLIQGSSAALDLPDDCVDAIVTDPPYFDSVQYSDLAAFFHVWLRQLLPDDAVWQNGLRLGDTAVEPTTNGKGEEYTAVLTAIFGECHRVLRQDHGRFIFTYHHWNPKGWAALTLALRRAGFVLVNRYVVHAENVISRHIVGQNALVHDVILVLAPAEQGVDKVWEAVTAVNLNDSYQFCRDCGSVLGNLLNSDLGEEEITVVWQDLLIQ